MVKKAELMKDRLHISASSVRILSEVILLDNGSKGVLYTIRQVHPDARPKRVLSKKWGKNRDQAEFGSVVMLENGWDCRACSRSTCRLCVAASFVHASNG